MKWKNLLAVLLVLFVVSSCCDQSSCPRCIEADDFGMPKVSVGAARLENDPSFVTEGGKDDGAFGPNQLIKWQETGIYATGDELLISIKGRWSSWYGNRTNSEIYNPAKGKESESGRSDICNVKDIPIPDDKICKYQTSIGDKCAVNIKAISDESANKENYPCWLINGNGLYLLFKSEDDPDPNKSEGIIRNPISPVVHVGQFATPVPGQNDVKGDFLATLSSKDFQLTDARTCEKINLNNGGEKRYKIYAKIIDRLYWDNVGGYQLTFKHGIDGDYQGFFENTRRVVKDLLYTTTKETYQNIIGNSDFIGFVRALLILFILITGLGFLLGIIQLTQTEVIIRIIKIAIVAQLISPNSWDFFYQNLFALFFDGIDELIGIINTANTEVTYNPEKPFTAIDDNLKVLFPSLFGQKMRAICLADAFGILWFLIVFVVLLMYILLLIYGFVIYLTSLVGISLMIILLPIFLVSIFFGFTKEIFDRWISMIGSFVFQAVLIFTLIAMMSSMILNSFYRTLGFRVCCNKTVDFSVGSLQLMEAWGWSPSDNFVPLGRKHGLSFSFSDKTDEILVPPLRKEKDCRYIDYPFFDPDKDHNTCPINRSPGYDKQDPDYIMVNAMQQGGGMSMFNNIIDLTDLFTMLLLAVLMYHMRLFVQKIGAAIAGTSPFTSVLGIAYTDGIFDLPGQLTGVIGEKFNKLAKGINNLGGNTKRLIGEKVFSALREKDQQFLRKVGDSTAYRKISALASATRGGLADLSGFSSDAAYQIRRREAFKEMDYLRSVIGYHIPQFTGDLISTQNGPREGVLNAMRGDKEFFDNPILRFAGKLGLHTTDKYLLKNTEDTLFASTQKAYRSDMEKLRDYYFGKKPYKPPEEKTEQEEARHQSQDQKPTFYQSPHSILGISDDATLAEARTAYRRLSRKCHPDKNPDDPEAAQKFDRITKAMRIIEGDEQPVNGLIVGREAPTASENDSGATSSTPVNHAGIEEINHDADHEQENVDHERQYDIQDIQSTSSASTEDLRRKAAAFAAQQQAVKEQEQTAQKIEKRKQEEKRKKEEDDEKKRADDAKLKQEEEGARNRSKNRKDLTDVADRKKGE